MNQIQALAQIATEFSKQQNPFSYNDILHILHQGLPFDTTILFQVENNKLITVATNILNYKERYTLENHPHFKSVATCRSPIRFPTNCSLQHMLGTNHDLIEKNVTLTYSNLGFPIRTDEKLNALLFLQSGNMKTFDTFSNEYLATICAITERQLNLLELQKELRERKKQPQSVTQTKMEDTPTSPCTMREAIKAFQIRLIHTAVHRNNGNWAAAARSLGMNRGNLHNMAIRLGIRN